MVREPEVARKARDGVDDPLGVEDDEVLIRIPEGLIGLKFDWIADAKLMLSDALIAESLKARKAAGTALPDMDESLYDEIEDADADGDEEDDDGQRQQA